jgi:predicted nucleic acid-binding protein
MRLAVDASTLVAEALRRRGRALLAHPTLDLFVAAGAWNETEHELRRRVVELVAHGHLDEPTATALLDEVLRVLAQRIILVPFEVYADYLELARLRIPRDPNDTPTVALALALDGAIWTGDRDFFGCGVAVWITDTLQVHLRESS